MFWKTEIQYFSVFVRKNLYRSVIRRRYTNSTEQNPYKKANSCSAIQKIYGARRECVVYTPRRHPSTKYLPYVNCLMHTIFIQNVSFSRVHFIKLRKDYISLLEVHA